MRPISIALVGYKEFAKQILRHAEGERLLLALAIVLSVLAAVTEAVGFGLLIPILESAQNLSGFDGVPLLRWFSGVFAGLSQDERLFWAALGLLGLTVIRGLLIYCAEIISYSLVPRVEARIKMKLFDEIHKMSISSVEAIPAGELNNITGVSPARVAISVRFTQLFVSNLIIVLVNALFMAIISPLLTLVILIVMCILTYIYKWLSGTALRDAGVKLTDATNEFSQLFHSTIYGMRLVKLSNATHGAKEQTRSAVQDLKAAHLKRLSIEATVFPFFATTIGVLFCVVLMGASMLQLGHNAELLATLVATIYLMTRLLGPMTVINVARTNIVANIDALEQIDKFMGISAVENERDGDLEFDEFRYQVTLKNITFRYPNQDLPILNNFDLTINKGETVGIVGLSGSGKSTIIGLLCRILRPEKGEIVVDSINLNRLKIETWWKRVAVVMQDMVFTRNSVRFNLTQGLPYQPSNEEILNALDTADVGYVIQELPNGLDTVLADRGQGLSGGERQRLSLARALLRKPDLLILDEATSNIDVQIEARIIDRLAERYPQLTILVIAHRLGAVRSCGRLIVLHAGNVHKEIFKNPELITGYPPLNEIIPTNAR